MKVLLLACLSISLGLLPWLSAVADEQLPPLERKIDFARDIQPIFAANCLKCHGPKLQESSYRLDVKATALAGGDLGEAAIVPGKSAASPLIRYVIHIDDDLQMPPEGKGRSLTAAEIAALRAWIDQGAAWPADLAGDDMDLLTTQHWSFQPRLSPAVPATNHPTAHNAIDHFVFERLQRAGLSPSPAANRTTLIRRLYLDMHGLPPTPEEVGSFLADDKADAYERLVDRLLASPRYGERWARHWLDVVRFAETTGFETNVPRPAAYHYRDYVIRALNDDLPYDQFVQQQLAGDALGAGAATGFLVGGPNDIVKSPDINLTLTQRQDELADMVNTTGTTFLGLTLGCARCHNHKFDPILQKDYYAMQAVFAGVQHGDRKIENPRSPAEEAELARLATRLSEIESELSALEPVSMRAQTIVLDDEMPPPVASGARGVTLLLPRTGNGINITGTARGNSKDPGGSDRLPNISGGRYSWWNERRGEMVMAYHPAATGKFHVWLSWGSGWNTHVRDAVYLLDDDGKTETTNDQRPLATIDQQRFADGVGDPANQPLWSGLQYVGTHEFKPTTTILLRAGKDGSATTADLAVLQADVDEGGNRNNAVTSQETEQKKAKLASRWPRLRPTVTFTENTEQFAPIAARYVRFTIRETFGGAEPCLDEIEVWTAGNQGEPARNIAREAVALSSSGDFSGNAKHKLEHINDGQYGNDRSWIASTPGKGWVMLELPDTALVERIVWQRDRKGEFLDRLPTEYTIEVAATPDAWEIVSSSVDRLPLAGREKDTTQRLWLLSPEQQAKAAPLLRERDTLRAQAEALSGSMVSYAGNFTSPPAIHRLYRGDPLMPKEEVAPAALTVLDEAVGRLGLDTKASEQTRRIALANWITQPDNPLTARVLANRLWHYHFGTGIVATPSDLGANGAKPSHPELLDYLASALVDGGWSMKKIHRLILLSHTYQQADTPRIDAIALDAQCRLLWRFPPHRLEAEVIRDSIHAVSGVLDETMYGPGFSLFQPNQNYVRVYEPKEKFGPAEWRRTIYMMKVRMEHDDVFGAFDSPDGGQICPRRSRSTTAIQALNMLNSNFIVQQSDLFAARLRREVGDDPRRQLEHAFSLTVSRMPDESELSAGVELISAHGLAAFCRALFNANEFLFLP